jgi:hypothetical protein
VGGQERVLWNPSLSIRPKEFDFIDTDAARIKAAIQTWHQYGAAADRRWLEPLVNALSFADLPQKGSSCTTAPRPTMCLTRGQQARPYNECREPYSGWRASAITGIWVRGQYKPS